MMYSASLVAQRLKRLPAMWETWVQSLGREDPLEKEMATHSSIPAWRIPWTEEPGTVHGVSKSWTQLKLLRNLYAGQETTVRTGHGTMNWFQIEKGARQSCILSPCLYNIYAEYITRNSGLDEAQAGIKIAGRNINNL